MKWHNFNIKSLRHILSSIWRLWFLIAFILVFFLFIPALFFFTRINRRPLIVAKLTRYWSLLTLWLSGVFLKIVIEEPLNSNEAYIICPNHVSSLDIPIVLAAFKIPVIFMAKKEYSNIPIFGYFYKNNTVIVNRDNLRDAYSAFTNSIEKLKEGLNVCIFPEGGIPKTEVKLRKFKNGPFKLALESNYKIVPVTMPNNKSMFPWNYFRGYPGLAHVIIHKPITVSSVKNNDIKNLNNTTYNTIFDELTNYENK